MAQDLDPDIKLSMYMSASPFYVDLGTPGETDTIADRLDTLPENLKNALMEEETAKIIWNLVVVKHGLSMDHVKTVARIMRDILMGRASAAQFRQAIQQRIESPQHVTDDLVKVLTQHLISPNYFQISQVYERRQKKELSSKPKPLERKPPLGPAAPSTEGTRNLIDLRNKTGSPSSPPNRLPPSPPPAPSPDDDLPDNFPTPA